MANLENSIIFNVCKGWSADGADISSFDIASEKDAHDSLMSFLVAPEISESDITAETNVKEIAMQTNNSYAKLYSTNVRAKVYDRPRTFEELPARAIYVTYSETAENKSFGNYNQSGWNRLIGYKTLSEVQNGNPVLVAALGGFETAPLWSMFEHRKSFNTGVQLPVIV